MYDLFFQRANGKYLLIKENIEEVHDGMDEISAFLKRHNYTSHYTRYWPIDNGFEFDVGSWSEFFILVKKNTIAAELIVGTEKDFIER